MSTALLLFGFLLLVGIIRGQGALIMLSSLLLVASLATIYWSARATDRLTYRRYFEPPRVFPGEETTYVVEVHNQKRLPLPWVRIEEKLPRGLIPVADSPRTETALGRPKDTDNNPRSQQEREGGGGGGGGTAPREPWLRQRTMSLGWHEKVVLRQRFVCPRRGDYVVGPAHIETGDPLGMSPVRFRVPETHCLLVYPRLAVLPPIVEHARFPYGSRAAKPPTPEDPASFAGIRDYRPGDPRRWVDWKASARRLKLQTRVFSPTSQDSMLIVLNMQTMPHAWQGYDAAATEDMISVAAALLQQAATSRHPFGLAANGCGTGMEDFQIFLLPNRRASQLEDSLALLATVAPIPTMPFPMFLRRLAASLPYGVTVQVVTSLLDEDTADELSELSRHGHTVRTLLVGAEVEHVPSRGVTLTPIPVVTYEPVEPTQDSSDYPPAAQEATLTMGAAP